MRKAKNLQHHINKKYVRGFTPLEVGRARERPRLLTGLTPLEVGRARERPRLLTGFTLLELLIVIGIIGILSSVTIVSYSYYNAKARLANTLRFAQNVRSALQDNMVAWWTFDETSGSTSTDNWLNGLNGRVYGAVWTEGIVNNALSFDGIDDYVDGGNAGILDVGTNDFTIELWAKANGGTYGRAIISKGGWSSIGYFISEAYSPSDKYYFGVRDSSGYKSVALNIGPSFEWTHIVGVKSNNHLEAWINGKKIGEYNGTIGSLSNSSQPLFIGKSFNNYYFNGLIDDVQIYNTALSADAIYQLYARGAQKHQPLSLQQ